MTSAPARALVRPKLPQISKPICHDAGFAGRMQNQVLPVLEMRQTARHGLRALRSVHNPTDEDVIPKWLLRAFKVEKGSTIVSVREEHGDKRDVKTLKRFQVTLDGGLCKKCNNERLADLEQVL